MQQASGDREVDDILCEASRSFFYVEISIAIKIDLILNCEKIESYPGSSPCPSAIILGPVESQACHVVAALCRDRVKIITVYWPDEEKWSDSRKRGCK
jgi:Domain of unknown function (DUF4258)